ncbi:filament-like plant protein 4 [Tanacetum coccineum]
MPIHTIKFFMYLERWPATYSREHVSKLDCLEIKRYLEMFYALKYRKLNVYDIVVAKTKQWDKLKLEFDAKVASLDQELMQSAAENAAVSRSLQQRSNMLIKIGE